MPFWKKKKGTEEEKTADKTITSVLKKSAAETSKLMRIVLLGAGGSGKSTILKQMQRLHADDELRSMGLNIDASDALGFVRRNVVEDIIEISRHCLSMCSAADCEVSPSESVLPLAKSWASLCHSDEVQLDEALALDVAIWWKDACIQLAFDSRKKSHVMDNTPYFFEKVVALSKMDYEVSFDDWVRLRHRTTGIISTAFPIDFGGDQWTMEVTDVGGQRSERKKWLRVFSDVNAVLYVMSLAAYDMWVFEDTTTRCYDETLKLFDDMVNVVHFGSTDFIVFLNKADLFTEKIAMVPFTAYEPSFPSEDARDGDAVTDYVTDMFKKTFEAAAAPSKKATTPNRHIYFHVTCAIDDKQIETVIGIIQMETIRAMLAKSALL